MFVSNAWPEVSSRYFCLQQPTIDSLDVLRFLLALALFLIRRGVCEVLVLVLWRCAMIHGVIRRAIPVISSIFSAILSDFIVPDCSLIYEHGSQRPQCVRQPGEANKVIQNNGIQIARL
jgi:hypothetical protein